MTIVSLPLSENEQDALFSMNGRVLNDDFGGADNQVYALRFIRYQE
jgi:hypothetical protein